MMSNIKVAVRVRPLNKREIELGSQNVLEINGDTISVTNLKVDSQPEYGDSRERVKVFTFDYCYDSSTDPCLPGYASQQLVFQDLGTEILEAAFEGYNACVFAYGQTSTGKTYTMMGDPGEAGLIPRICEGLFSRVDDFIDENFTFKVDISYLEIYNERVRDLLQSPLLKPSEKYTLKVREHPKEGPYVQDLSRHLIKDNNEIQALIEKANENRTTSSTHMHEHSSRSHAIVTVTFTQARLEDDLPSEIVSKVHLVDLAGSERASTTTTTNYKDRLKEGANINKSLVTLGNVIKCLAERSLMSLSADDAETWNQGSSDVLMTSSIVTSRKQRTLYVPYRDSVLTWLLKDSLGGNSKTIMISTISPASIYYNETVSTLRYAQRAKSIINKPKINEDSNVTLIKELRREIERLRDMLATAQTKPEPEPCPDTVDMKENLMSLQESSTFLSEKLEKNEAAAKKLTMHWIEKWQETHDILTTDQLSVKMTCKDDENEKPIDKISKMLNPTVKLLLESDLSIRRPLGQRTNSMGVIVDSQQPHLRGMDDDILSTGIVLYYLKEGKTLIGGEAAERDQDIVLSGPSIQPEHCFIQHINGDVVLHPNRGATCTINGIEIKQPTKLTQGDTILIGKTHLFRFNNPAEAARLREFRKSVAKNELENGSPLGSMDSVAASESGSSSQNCASPAPLMSSSFSGELDRTSKNNKSNIKQVKQELQLVTEQLQKVSGLYEKQEEQMWEMQEKQKQEEDDLRKKLSEMLAKANQMRLQAEKEIAKAKAKMDKETALFKKAMQKELAEAKGKKQSLGQSSVSDLEKIKKQLEEELNRKSSLQESKKVLEQKVHEMQKLCQKSKLEVSEHEQNAMLLKKEHERLNQQQKQDVAAMLDEIKKLKQQKEDLEMFLDDKKNLRKVAQDKPAPLRGACSEETVCYEAHRSPSFTDVKDLKGDRFRRGSDGDLPSLSNRITMSTTSLMSESLIEDPHECSSSLSEGHHKSSDCSVLGKDVASIKEEKSTGSKTGMSKKKSELPPSKGVGRNGCNAGSKSVGREASEEPIEDVSLVPGFGEDECYNVALAEDQMSNYSQDSLDRMEDEEQFNVSPETEAASAGSNIINPSSPAARRLERQRNQKSASPGRQSGIPVAKHSPSPVRKIKDQSSSSKPSSASAGTNTKSDPKSPLHKTKSDEPPSKGTTFKLEHSNIWNIQNHDPQSFHSSESGSINHDSKRPAETLDKKKTVPASVTQPKVESSANSKDLSKVMLPNTSQANSKNSVPSSQRSDNHNLTNSPEKAPKTVTTVPQINNVREGQNKDKISTGPKRAETATPGTTNAQHPSKNPTRSSLVSNKTKPPSPISTGSDQNQLAKRSSSHVPTAGANKEHVSTGVTCKNLPPVLGSDGDQHSQKNSQNLIGPQPNSEQSLLNSNSKQAPSRTNMLSPTLETSNPLSKIQSLNPKTLSSSSPDSDQKKLNKQCLPLTQKRTSLSSTDLKQGSPVLNAEGHQKYKAQSQGCETSLTGKQNSPCLPRVSSVHAEEYHSQQLKNPESLHAHQSKSKDSVNPRKDQEILKSQALKNGPVKQPDQCISKTRQGVNQDKIPESMTGQKPSQNSATKTPISNVSKGKLADQSSSQNLLKPDQNSSLSQLSGTDTLSDSVNSELSYKSEYFSQTPRSSNRPQEPLSQCRKGNIMEDSLEASKRTTVPKDHYSTTRISEPEHSFTPPDSIENKKEFSVVTRDSCRVVGSNQSAPSSKDQNNEVLTDASESSDSEIKRLTGGNLLPCKTPAMTTKDKQLPEGRGVEKKQTQMANHASLSKNANLIPRCNPGKISRVSQNSFVCPGTQMNGDMNGISSSEEGHGREITTLMNEGGNLKKTHNGNQRLADDNKKKVSPFTYIVKVNQEETNVFYNVEATDYTVSTIRKHYAKNNPISPLGKDIGNLRNDLGNKPQNSSSPLLDQSQFSKGTRNVMGSVSISDMQHVADAGSSNSKRTTTSSAPLPRPKASLSSQSSSSVSSSLMSSSLSSSSPPGQCQQSDDIPDSGLAKTSAANIPKTEDAQKCDSWHRHETRALSRSLSNKAGSRQPGETSKSESGPNHHLNRDQDPRLAPVDCQNLPAKRDSQRPQTLSLSLGGPESTAPQLPWVSDKQQNKEDYRLHTTTNGTWPRAPKTSNGDYSYNTHQCASITSNKKFNLPPELVNLNFTLYNRQQQKRSKVLTRCVSDSAISSDLTDIDSSNLSPQPSHLPAWFSMQHVSYPSHKNSSMKDRISISRAPVGSQKKLLSNTQTCLKTINRHESTHDYIECLLKLKPFSYDRSLSLDGLNQLIISRDRSMSSEQNLESEPCGYPFDKCLSDRLSPRGEVSESDDASRSFPHRCMQDVFDRKRNKGGEIKYQNRFQDDSQRDPTSSLDSSSSPSSASPYMVRCKNDGSLLNLSQEEFNNLEQNLPSDISSLVSSFDGCYLGHGQASPGKEGYALREDNARSLGFSSDDAAVLNSNPRQKPSRAPLRLALCRFSSSGEPLEADNIEDRVLRNLRPAGQRDWTSTADSDETLYEYCNMPTYPPDDRNREHRPESDSDTSDFQIPAEHYRRPRAKNNPPMYHSSKSASVTDLPGDYPTSTSSYRTGSPSLSSELPGDLIDEEEESLKYISIGIQASQTECATQTEDAGSSPTDFTMPRHATILKDSVASNMLPFPFNIPYLMAEASAGTFNTLPALMLETTTLLKNLSKQLTVEPNAPGSSPSGTIEKRSNKCSVTTQTDRAQPQRYPQFVSPPPLPQPSSMCSSSYSSTPSSIHYAGNYPLDHGAPSYPSQRSHPEITIQQNNYHPGMTVNHDMMHTQNYINPRLTPNHVSSNTYPFPYHSQHPEMQHGSLPNRRDMHLPVGNDAGTLKSNCSMADFWKGDMCESFTYIPNHQTLPNDEMPSPGQKPYPGFAPATRMSPHDQNPNLHANRIFPSPDGNLGQYQNCQPQPGVDNNENRYSRQFKFNQTSPLPNWNYDKFSHSMKYTSQNSEKRLRNDLINYSEYNLDSTTRDVHFQPDWRMSRGEYLPAELRGSQQKPQNHDLSASAPDRFQGSVFEPHPPKSRLRSMTMDCSSRSHLRPDNLYSPSFHRSSTLPHSGLASLGPNGDNFAPPREFAPSNQFSSTPRMQQHSRSRTGGLCPDAAAASFVGGDGQPDHYLSEDLNISLKNSGLTDEYLQLLSKSARSLPKMETPSMPVSEGRTRDPKTLKILEEASKLLNTNSSHSQILSETHETKSYPESVNGAGFRGVDHLEGTLNSASSIDQSQNNELRSVMKINEEYANMIASDGKQTTDMPKNSTLRHKNKSQKRQALHNQFKEWEREQLDIMDMVNLKYLPVSFTVKYLEKKVNHCIAQTDLLLDSLDDEDPTTTSAVSEANSTTTMDEDVFESSSASNTRLSGLSMDYLQLPQQQQQQQENSRQDTHTLSNSSLFEAGFDTGSELSPNAWLQLQSSIPNLLTDDAATDGDVSWTDEMGYLHNDAERPIDTLTYTKSSVASSMTDLSQDNSDQTISESQDISSQGSLGQDAMSMLEEVSRFRKFYSAEIEKIRDGLTEMDVRVLAHQSSSRSGNSKSRRHSHHKNQISSCDKTNRSRSLCPLSSNRATNQMLGSKDCMSDTSAPHKPRSSPLILRQRSSSTDL